LLARGLSNKEIAERLVISPKTVANHAEHIYAKIDAPTRAGVGLFAMQHGLLPEEEFSASLGGLSGRSLPSPPMPAVPASATHRLTEARPSEVIMARHKPSRTSLGEWAVQGSNLRPWD
jgi:hypothetical protein